MADFHQTLQEVTNFPLRPFVLPFLKANIPLLARDVAGLAVLTCQSPYQYLTSHQHLLLELPSSSSSSAIPANDDLFHRSSEVNSTTSAGTKRRTSSGESVENEDEAESVAKRARGINNDEVKRRQQQRVYPQPWGRSRDVSYQHPPPGGPIDQGGIIGGGTGVGGQHEDEWRNIHVVSGNLEFTCAYGIIVFPAPKDAQLHSRHG